MCGAKYCHEYVCLSIRLHNSKTTFGQTSHQIFVHDIYGRGSVLRWWSCDTLCTSGFVDDVMFMLSQDGHVHVPRVFLSGDSTRQHNRQDSSLILLDDKDRKYSLWVAHWGWSLQLLCFMCTEWVRCDWSQSRRTAGSCAVSVKQPSLPWLRRWHRSHQSTEFKTK